MTDTTTEDSERRMPLAVNLSDQLGPLVEATGLLACIDDEYLKRGDWVPMVQAFASAVQAAERERWESALRTTWRMVDPLRPEGQPGSYARGNYNGIVAALGTLRANLRA